MYIKQCVHNVHTETGQQEQICYKYTNIKNSLGNIADTISSGFTWSQCQPGVTLKLTRRVVIQKLTTYKERYFP